MPHPDEHDPRPGGPRQPRERDALDTPPPQCLPVDRRRHVEGHQALGVLAGTVGIVGAVLLVLDGPLPGWCRGFLLLLGPVLVGAALARYRLPAWGRPAVLSVAATYAGVLLLVVG